VRLLANRDDVRRVSVILICLLILLFGFQARANIHGRGFVGQVRPHDSHKARFEATVSKTLLPAVVTSWFVASTTYYLLLHGQPLVPRVFSSMVAHDGEFLYRRQFLRPPPVSCS
jgi:hypothetical protein